MSGKCIYIICKSPIFSSIRLKAFSVLSTATDSCIKKKETTDTYMMIYHTYDTKYGHYIYSGNLQCFQKCILIILLQFKANIWWLKKCVNLTKKVDSQYFCTLGAPLVHIGQHVLTRCWPKCILLKDHFKVTGKCIYIVRISPIFANLRNKTFWAAVAAAKGHEIRLRSIV